MMVLYSGSTCLFSHRCRFVLYEKGMDFEIRDVDPFTKPDEIVNLDGVKILGDSNLLNKLPISASNLYSKNLLNFVVNLYDKKK